MTSSLLRAYNQKKNRIIKRLKEFDALKRKSDPDIFAELCFCILTPQSKAVYCDKAIKELKKSGLLYNGTRNAIKKKLYGVRFPNNKSGYLVAARKSLTNGKTLMIKNRLRTDDVPYTRDWFVKNIKGLGYKEASHFLRNIGLGDDIAILDVHILRNLIRYKVIPSLPKNLSRSYYLAIEDRLKIFSKKIKIPMPHLDLLFWSNETGIIFK